jgi:gas vesicle protein
MGNKSNFALGALIGAAAGVAIGILFAPRSGKETRNMLGDKAKEYTEKSKEVLEKSKEVAKEKIKATADSISKQMDK